MGKLKCKNCKYLLTAEDISMISRLMGYTVECGKTEILFNLEEIETEPLWCPRKSEDTKKQQS